MTVFIVSLFIKVRGIEISKSEKSTETGKRLRLPQFLFLFLIPGRVGFWPIFKKKQTRFGNKTPSFFIVFSLSELQVKIFLKFDKFSVIM